MPNETTLTDEQQDMMDVELVLLKADRLAHRQERLPEWFLQKLKESDAVGEAIKANYKGMMAELAMRRRAFILEWGAEFRTTVQADLAAVNKSAQKPRKIMKYLTGQAGTRKSQDKIVVQDAKLAAKWAWEHAKGACDITLARTGPLLEHLKASRKVDPETGEETMEQIPGCVFVAGHDSPTPKLEPLDDLPAPVDRPVLTDLEPDVSGSTLLDIAAARAGTVPPPDDSLGDFMAPKPAEQPF